MLKYFIILIAAMSSQPVTCGMLVVELSKFKASGAAQRGMKFNNSRIKSRGIISSSNILLYQY